MVGSRGDQLASNGPSVSMGDPATGWVNVGLNAAALGYDIFNSERNYQSQQGLLEYQQALQERILNREDSAFQRHVKDVQAAGFSPLAALGGSSSAGSTVSMSAPQRNISAVNALAAQDALMNSAANRQYLRAQADYLNSQTDTNRHNLEYYSSLGMPTNSSMTERLIGDVLKVFGTNLNSLSSDIRSSLQAAQEWLNSHQYQSAKVIPETIQRHDEQLEKSMDLRSSAAVPKLSYPEGSSLKDRRKTWKQAHDEMMYMYGDLAYKHLWEQWERENPFPQ